MNISIETRKQILLTLFGLSFLPLLFYIDSAPAKFLENEEGYSLMIGIVLGYTGAILLWWSLWLGFKGFVGKIVVDHIWLNDLHRKVGTYGTLLIFAHPIFIVLSSVISQGLDTGLSYFIPSLETEYQKHIFIGTIAFDLLLLIWVSSAILRSKIKFRPWRYIHYLSLAIFPLVYFHAKEIGSGILSNNELSLYFDFLFITFIFGLLFRAFNQFGMSKYEFILTEKRELVDGTFEYTFAPNNGRVVNCKPGQYFYIQPRVFAEDHPFTAAKLNSFDGSIAFCIKTYGKFTKHLENLEIGKKVFLDGPYGVFTRNAGKNGNPMVFIAGGVGISPFIRYASNPGLDQPELLIYGETNKKDIAYKNLVQKSFSKVVFVLSDLKEKSEDYEAGFITEEILRKNISKDIKLYEYFVCGPPIMMHKVEEFLLASGVKHEQIHMEKFSL